MDRLDLCTAFHSVNGSGTKEDIVIQVARQENIRFNDLPQLQKDVDCGLAEAYRLGFIECNGNGYQANFGPCGGNSYGNGCCPTDALQGQGDYRRSRAGFPSKRNSTCLGCGTVGDSLNSVDKHELGQDKSICSVCGLNSDILLTTESTDVN